jgi:acetyltransferase-like isoleucine patch superfamily enzyme
MIGELTWIGIGSIVIQSLNIGSNIIIGAGSIVIDSILDPGTYVGRPARLINKL